MTNARNRQKNSTRRFPKHSSGPKSKDTPLERIGKRKRGTSIDIFRRADRVYAKKAIRLELQRGILVPLLTKEDGFDGYYYFKTYLKSDIARPYIRLMPYKRSRDEKDRIKRVDLVYAHWAQDPYPTVPPPYSLLLSSFDTGHPARPHLQRTTHLPYEFILGGIGRRANEAIKGRVPSVFGNQTLYTFCHNIWNVYTQRTGESVIGRVEFCAWIYRLTALATDLLDYPFHQDPSPGKRREVIKAVVRNKYGQEFDCYDLKRWRPLMRAPRFDAEEALRTRLLDARGTYLRFRQEVKNDSPLKEFLHELGKSLFQKLAAMRMLRKCPVCGDYFIYRKGKKYCSPAVEKKTCGKTIRNKRAYSRYILKHGRKLH